MLSGFRAFIMRGNVLDLAVAVIIGAAFASIVKSLTDDIIMPIVGALSGGRDFSGYYTVIGPIPEKAAGLTSYADLKKAGVAMIGWGQFLTSIVSFVILAFIIYMIIQAADRLFRTTLATPATPDDVLVLREIRDELKARPLA